MFGDWRTDIKRPWRADIGRALTPAEEAAHQRRVDALRRAREAEDSRRHAEARQKASEIWKVATAVASDHPYLVRKQVSPVESLREIHTSAAVEILGYPPKCRG
jgi:putative DNA primase/helicase